MVVSDAYVKKKAYPSYCEYYDSDEQGSSTPPPQEERKKPKDLGALTKKHSTTTTNNNHPPDRSTKRSTLAEKQKNETISLTGSSSSEPEKRKTRSGKNYPSKKKPSPGEDDDDDNRVTRKRGHGKNTHDDDGQTPQSSEGRSVKKSVTSGKKDRGSSPAKRSHPMRTRSHNKRSTTKGEYCQSVQKSPDRYKNSSDEESSQSSVVELKPDGKYGYKKQTAHRTRAKDYGRSHKRGRRRKSSSSDRGRKKRVRKDKKRTPEPKKRKRRSSTSESNRIGGAGDRKHGKKKRMASDSTYRFSQDSSPSTEGSRVPKKRRRDAKQSYNKTSDTVTSLNLNKQQKPTTAANANTQGGHRKLLPPAPTRRQKPSLTSIPTIPPLPPVRCDTEGHLIYKPGDVIQDRFEIVRTLGEGTFGKVVECLDRKFKIGQTRVSVVYARQDGFRTNRVALKIIKNVPKYREAAKLEINVFNHLKHKVPG